LLKLHDLHRSISWNSVKCL